MKKPAKVVLATTLGAALLLGGSTYALWSANVTPETSATIQTGGSDLTANNAGAWIDSVRSAANPTDPAVVITDINEFRTVPGDKLTFDQSFNVSASGADSQTKFSVTLPNDAAIDVAALRARGIILTVQITDDESGAVLASSPAAGNTLATDYTFDGATGDAGKDIGVRFVFEFQSTVTADDTKNLQVVVENAVVAADQVS